MTIITAGYDGTVNEVQFAELLHRHAVIGPEDFKATTQAGDRIVAISDGRALGPGTIDVATALPAIQFASASGTRWDLVAIRRDWQPPGGSSGIVVIQGGSAMDYPAVGTAATAWNRRPGIVDDQPLYLQEVSGTLLGARIDLRVWAGNGGLFANHDLVRTYLDKVGTEVDIKGSVWALQVGANGLSEWAKTSEIGKIPVFGVGNSLAGGAPAAGVQFLVQAGTSVSSADGAGYGRITFPKPFPNGVLYARADNGDYSIDAARGTSIHFPIAGAPDWPDSVGVGSFVYAVESGSGAKLPGALHRANWIAIGW